MSENLRNLISARVRETREALSLTQKQFAERLGVSRSTICLYEAGTSMPDAEFMHNLAQIAPFNAEYLLGLSDVKTQETDVRAICRQTGLSEKAVQKISACCARRYLNRLLEEDNFYALANTLESLHMANRRLPFFDVDHFMQTEEAVKAQFGQEYDLLSPTDRLDMLRYDITYTGNELLNHLMEEAKRNGQKGK